MTTQGVDHLYELCGWLSTRCGLVNGRSLFADVLPDDSTGLAAYVIEERGPMPHVLQSSGYIRRPRMRFGVRSTAPTSTQGDYPNITAARNKVHAMFQACMDLAGITLQASSSATPGNWLFVNPDTEPYLAGRDDHNRVHFEYTAQAERQQAGHGGTTSTSDPLAMAWLSGEPIDWLSGEPIDWMS